MSERDCSIGERLSARLKTRVQGYIAASPAAVDALAIRLRSLEPAVRAL